MKKTYINPEMEVIEVKADQTLLAGSPIPIGGSTDTVDTREYNPFDFE